jgi:hypothetical protein
MACSSDGACSRRFNDLKRYKHRQAGLKAAATKGDEDRRRAAHTAAQTRKHGKHDANNPFSKQHDDANHCFVPKM